AVPAEVVTPVILHAKTSEEGGEWINRFGQALGVKPGKF
ncbi:hypothetical protein FOPG_17314, partial [Fusarium oxysporum f. sp. conglutinans race 2 54008]